MAPKLTPRQQAQLAWIDQLPKNVERLNKIIELMAAGQADDTVLRAAKRLVDTLKAQAGGLALTNLGDAFGYMAAIFRRTGATQTRVQGLRELLMGLKVNVEGAKRAASTPLPDAEEAE